MSAEHIFFQLKLLVLNMNRYNEEFKIHSLKTRPDADLFTLVITT